MREALDAYAALSIYTTAEACPMCSAAIRQAGFAEYVYATSTKTLIELGWPQIDIDSAEVFRRSGRLARETRFVGGVLAEETDGLFKWQFQEGGECPAGCERVGRECLVSQGHDEL